MPERADTEAQRLPPGQHRIAGFPRFGTHGHKQPPPVPDAPVIAVAGAVERSFEVPLSALAALPRREMSADFHCVSGWTATNLRWEGVPFVDFYRKFVEPELQPGQPVTHLVFGALDGYRSVVCLEDALADDVLIAQWLDGRPLDGDHGAPARLVSPSQYGFVSTKHLCRIEVHTRSPEENYGSASAIGRIAFQTPLFRRHPRARVWHEERHRYLPGWAVRPAYALLIAPIAFVSRLGSSGARKKLSK